MADDVDMANDLTDSYIEEVTNKIRKQREKEREHLVNICERECDECGEIIPLKRLQSVPLAKLCVHCQSLLEKRH